MAEYQPIISATVEAYQLGEDSPPDWYATLIASKDIVVAPQDSFRYTVLTTTAGPKPALKGDYVIYDAGVSLIVMDKATFEAAYEPVPEDP